MHNYGFKKKLIFFLIVIIIPIFVAILCAEIYIRLFSQFGYITPETLKNRSLQYSASLFSRHVFPQKEQLVDGWDNAKWHINKLGYRGNNFSIVKPKETVRIIFYGGSAVFNSGSPQGKDWPHRVGNILRQNGFRNIEVINAGIPGHASFDSFGRLFAEGHTFKPDYVVINNAWNDIKYFRAEMPLLRQFLPYIESKDPLLNYQGPVDRFLAEHSQLYVRLRHRYYSRKLHIGNEGVKPIGKYSSEIGVSGLRQYKLNLEMFVDLARNIGAVPILMTQPRLLMRNNTESQKARIAYEYQFLTHGALCDAFEKTDEIIRNIAKTKNVSVIDASKYLTGKDAFFRDHVHLTDKGAEKLAYVTAQHLAELLRIMNQY